MKKKSYALEHWSKDKEFAKTSVTSKSTAVDVFRSFLSVDLLKQIWDDCPEEHWFNGQNGYVLSGKFNLKSVYVYFVTFIWIMGNGPRWGKVKDHFVKLLIVQLSTLKVLILKV